MTNVAFCDNCGVEVNSSIKKCPLCFGIIGEEEAPDVDIQDYPVEIEEEIRRMGLTSARKRFLAWEITSVVLIIPFPMD